VRKSDSRAQNVLSAPIRATLAPVQPNVPPVETPDPEQVLSSSDRGTELTLKEETMDSRSPAQSLTLLEAGFKILPGKEEGFFALQQKMVPVAAKQPGKESRIAEIEPEHIDCLVQVELLTQGAQIHKTLGYWHERVVWRRRNCR
jgi:hypothetical protein